jgi:hypothetical protein
MNWRAAGAALFLVGSFPLGSRGAETKPAPSARSAPLPKPSPPNQAPAPKPAAVEPAVETPDENVGHHRQANFRAEFVTGYRMLFRYDKSPRCAPFDRTKSAADQQKFCGFGAPASVGVAIGFSFIDFFEPFVFARFGLANEADHSNQGKLLQVGAGARLYTMSDSRFKIFFAPSLGLDLTSGPVDPIRAGAPGTPGTDDRAAGVTGDAYRTDLLARLEIGPHYDFSRTVGAYAAGGLTFQMLRYLGASADLMLGVQLRAP